MNNKERIQQFKEQLQNMNWTWVIYGSGLFAAIGILIAGLSYFAADRAAQLRGIEETRSIMRSTLHALATYATDYDRDDVLEPVAGTDLQGNNLETVGYFIPPSINVVRQNPKGQPFLYCAWDYGKIVDVKRYYIFRNSSGQAEIISSPPPTAIMMALIDPGLNLKYETRCANITTPSGSVGDDIVETLNITDLRQLGIQKVGSKRKNILTCAFGQIYVWNEVKQDWDCQTPSSAQAINIPAGCPTGQVLVERNKRIRCEDKKAIVGEELTPSGGAMPAGDATKSNLNNVAPLTQTDSPTPQKLASDPANLPKPADAEFIDRNNSTVLNTQGTPAPAATNEQAALAYEQDLESINNTAQAYAAVQKKNASINQVQAAGRKIIRTPGPGEMVGGALEEEFEDTDPSTRPMPKGRNLIGSEQQITETADAIDPSLEREIKKDRKPKQYKLKSCAPWLYLPRSVGVTTQCVRVNNFGDMMGNSAYMTSWPSAKTFLSAAFMFCPVAEFGIRPPCRPIQADRNLFMTNTKPSIFDGQDGFLCARLYNPLPPPWPQFESFMYSESTRQGRCRMDQMPYYENTGNGRRLLCMPVAEVINNYQHNGYCGCGWSLIWNPEAGRLICS